MTQRSEGNLRRRGRILAACLALFLVVIIGRLVQLQLVEGAQWRALAAAVQERQIELPPRRGSITDRDGTLLAFDVKATAIAVDGYNMTKPETLLSILAEELGETRQALSDLVYRASYFTWIDRAVDLETAQRIRERAGEAGAHGLIFFDAWKRCYPQGRLASNLIGFVGLDGVGLEGIELAHDDALRGTPTRLHVVEGADGRTYQTRTIDPGTPGQDIQLTIDAGLQFACEEEIEEGVAAFQANGGMIVVLDPSSGDVLAMAQDKGFDLNAFWTSTAEERKNLATSFLFEPGSIFKAFTGLAALDAGVVSVDDVFDGNDGIEITGHEMHNADFISYGTVTFAEIIEHSVNTAMIRVAFQLGVDPFYEALVDLGFGQATGIELPGEEEGILRPPTAWTPLDLAAASIGQSVAVTGLQLARGVAAIANDGLLPPIHILAQEDASTSSANRVTDPGIADTMCALLERVVRSGTGTLAAIPGFSVAGKTGTAQKATPGRGYVDEKYTSLFAGILPADDPQYVVVVVLDEVKTATVSGGYTAGQIFRATATRLIHTERVPSTSTDTYEVGSAVVVSASPQGQAQSGQSLFGRPQTP